MTTSRTVVIGSGFGGSVAACRLAEAGVPVVVLERGREWDVDSYPSETNRDWVFDAEHPERRNGWLDVRLFPRMMVVQGAGVGGGSLVYANVSVPPPPSTFASGWPEAIDADELAPYVERVGRVLEVQRIPEHQRTRRWHFVHRAAEALGQLDRFDSLPLAVHFDPDYDPSQLDDPDSRNDRSLARPYTNPYGAEMRSCIHLGQCDAGCPVKAKATLDLNYLRMARQHGAEVRPLHVARRVEKVGRHWRVHFDRITGSRLEPGTLDAERVILAAGSLGSTELLLRSRLPGVSPLLGHGWSSNGDVLTPALCEDDADPTVGPTITACIDHTDGDVYGHEIFIQDGGFPNLLYSWARDLADDFPRALRGLASSLVTAAEDAEPLEAIMPWFAQGIDRPDGRLRLRRKWIVFGRRRLWLDWDPGRSTPVFEAILSAHRSMAEATGGEPIVSPFWKLFHGLATPHPLGGCNMADDARGGVVDHAGRVFGHEGLHVVDGSVIPRAIGRNPSRTIAAVAERAVEQWMRD